ncbi:hypothetical protein K9M48_01325 [Candidatus Gracilibacteria bacterium]|nr:hypothetical protein [Candidatus Gracilibacteria bacterium]
MKQETLRKTIKKILIMSTLLIAFGLTQKTNGQYYYYDSGTSTYPYQQGCNEELNLRINTQGDNIRAGRFHLILDPSTTNYNTSSDSTTLRTNLFEANNQTFIDRSSAASPSRKDPSKIILQIDRSNSTTDYNGSNGLYGVIKFIPVYNPSTFYGSFGMEYTPGAYTTETTLSFAGGTEAINPSEQNTRLTGTYQILQEPCIDDTNSPSINISTPINQGNKQSHLNGISLSLDEAVGVIGSNVPYIWTGGHTIWTGNPGGTISNQYGINLNTFTLTINGNSQTKTFTGGSLGVNAIGNDRTRQDNYKNYNITISSGQLFDYGIEKTITITTSVDDLKGNHSNLNTINFNYPISPRALGNFVPSNGAIFVNLSAPVQLGIQDNRAGVDSGSIRVTLSGINGTNYGPYIFSGSDLNLSGVAGSANQPDYYINITNHIDFPASGTIKVSVYAEDMENNVDNINDYTFTTRPNCGELQCCDVTIITRDDQIDYNQDTIYISGRNSPIFYTGVDGSGYIDCNSTDVGMKIYNGDGLNSGSASVLSNYYDFSNLLLSGRNGVSAILSGDTIYLSITSLFGYNITGAILFYTGEIQTGTLVGIEDIDLTIENSFDTGIVMQSTGNQSSPEVIEAYIPPNTTIIQTGAQCLPVLMQHPILTGKNYAQSGLIDYDIYTAFKIGFICSGSQAKFYDNSGDLKEIEIRIKDPNLVESGVVKVRYSNDLVNRNTLGTANVVNYIASFQTTHFTYFALGDDKPTRQQPPCIGCGGGGGGGLTKDDCPDGDYSDSYYDRDCGDPDSHQITNFCGVGPNKYSTEMVDAFQYAYGLGITTMCPIESARLDQYILRKELAKMISEFAIKVIGIYPDFSKTECDEYNDIRTESQELQFYMRLSCRLGLMGLHTDGITVKYNFDPNQYVDRAQFGTIMSRLIFGGTYNGNKDNRYIDHLNALKAHGVMNYIDNPAMKELRGYVMIMMQRADESGIIKRMRPVIDFINGAHKIFDILGE